MHLSHAALQQCVVACGHHWGAAPTLPTPCDVSRRPVHVVFSLIAKKPACVFCLSAKTIALANRQFEYHRIDFIADLKSPTANIRVGFPLAWLKPNNSLLHGLNVCRTNMFVLNLKRLVRTPKTTRTRVRNESCMEKQGCWRHEALGGALWREHRQRSGSHLTPSRQAQLFKPQTMVMRRWRVGDRRQTSLWFPWEQYKLEM